MFNATKIKFISERYWKTSSRSWTSPWRSMTRKRGASPTYSSSKDLKIWWESSFIPLYTSTPTDQLYREKHQQWRLPLKARGKLWACQMERRPSFTELYGLEARQVRFKQWNGCGLLGFSGCFEDPHEFWQSACGEDSSQTEGLYSPQKCDHHFLLDPWTRRIRQQFQVVRWPSGPGDGGFILIRPSGTTEASTFPALEL